VRLSITLLDLLDQGALTERILYWSLHESLRAAEVQPDPGFEREKQVRNLNIALNKLRHEAVKLSGVGRQTATLPLAAASLNVGQLAVLLKGTTSVEDFIQRVTIPATSGSGNPILEFLRFQHLPE
jgi:hypothetical protein